MAIIIWGIPFIILFGSTIYFNKRGNHPVFNFEFLFFTILDFAISYSFVMFLLRLTIANELITGYALLFIFLISSFIHLKYSNTRDDDSDLAIETIKNNIILIFISFVPFLIFTYVFRDFPLIQKYGFSIFLSGVVFAVSLYIKIYVEKVLDNIRLNIQFSSDFKLIWIFYTAISIIILILLFFFIKFIGIYNITEITYDQTYSVSGNDEENIIDWHNVNIFDIVYLTDNTTGFNAYMIALVGDEDNQEYLLTIHPYSPLNSIELTSDANELSGLSSNSRILHTDDYIVLPSTGLYIYTVDGATVLDGTKGYPVSYFTTSDNSKNFLIDQLDGTYIILDQDYEQTDIIDTNVTNQDLVVINDYLFTFDNNRYARFDDSSITFTKNLGTPYYDSVNDALYTLIYGQNTVKITRETLSCTSSKTIDIEDGFQILPIFDGYFINPLQLLNFHQRIEISDDLFIDSSHIEEDDWITVLVYHPDKYILQQNSDSSRISILQVNDMMSYVQYKTHQYDFKEISNEIQDSISAVKLLYIVIPSILFFIPITDYKKYIKVVAFEQAIEDKFEW